MSRDDPSGRRDGLSLTRRQAEALAFVRSENAAGRFPKAGAINRALRLNGKGGGQRLATALVERGHVARFLAPADIRNRHPGALVVVPECRKPLAGER